jgi:hypothetical protein
MLVWFAINPTFTATTRYAVNDIRMSGKLFGARVWKAIVVVINIGLIDDILEVGDEV